MRTATRAVCVLAALALLPQIAAAQIKQIFQPSVPAKECPSQLNPPPAGSKQLLECVKALPSTISEKAQQPTTPQLISPAANAQANRRAANTELLQEYATYLAARKAVKNAVARNPTDSNTIEAHQLIEEKGRTLHEALQKQGLEQTSPLVGELRAGAVITSAGAIGGSAATEARTNPGNVLAHIVWQTAHAAALNKSSGADYSLEGKFGSQPALTLLKSPDANQQQLVAQYQQGLVVDAAFSGSYFSGSSEWSLVARGGLVRFGELAQVVESNGSSYLAYPVGSSDQVAPYFEIAMRGALFDQPLAVAHIGLNTLAPRLMGEVAYRRDTRFAQTGEAVTVSAPEDRLVLRFMLDGLNVIDKRTLPATNKVFKFAFGVEYQRGWKSGGVPSGFSLVIRGDADLLRALQGSQGES